DSDAALLSQSNTLKSAATSAFAAADYPAAITGYERALAALPTTLDYDIAVLHANIAACHLKLAAWRETIDAATQALEELERVDPTPKKPAAETEAQAVVEEVTDEAAGRIDALAASGRTTEDVRKIRAKALLRRAKARSELGGWGELAGAEEDYKVLDGMANLTALDRATVRRELRTLKPRLEDAKQREMGDMMGKLKELGNGILKPFGLSTDNFNMVQDETTGGYNLQFNQG
ncbi:hypothetical protein EJ06DRAFT_452168, partial [Trichodelitschia bisporula]